jgi:hypothetical protein
MTAAEAWYWGWRIILALLGLLVWIGSWAYAYGLGWPVGTHSTCSVDDDCLAGRRHRGPHRYPIPIEQCPVEWSPHPLGPGNRCSRPAGHNGLHRTSGTR